MKILFILFCCLSACFSMEWINFEPKIGIAPYQNLENNNESESFNIPFLDYGLDIYTPKIKGFQIGGGAELRRISPYLSDQKYVGLFFTLLKIPTFLDTLIVFRAGFLQNASLDKSFYYALGIEKSINRFIFQVLYDDMQLKNNVLNSHYHSIVFKVGIRI